MLHAEVVLRALSSLAVEERAKALEQMRKAVRSIDEELPVTETAAHGIGRSRGLHARADRMLLVVELLRAWQIPGADRPVFIPREKLRQPLPRLPRPRLRLRLRPA